MRWRGWERIPLRIEDTMDPQKGRTVTALAPLIISASRSTDIPAFYGRWFLARLRAGYAVWQSPFGGDPVYVSFAKARVFAFWSKNPEPFIPCLTTLDTMGYGYFFLVTLNDYENENVEPCIPPLEKRIETFIRLSERLGPGRIVWRFDPFLLTDTLSVSDLLDRIRGIGDRIHPFTRRLAISFIDIGKYRKVRRNLGSAGFPSVREFTDAEVGELARGLSAMNRRWNLTITTCGEHRDLSIYGIGRGECIGYDLLATEFSDDPVLIEFLSVPLQQAGCKTGAVQHPSRYFKDPGQRGACGCIVSKDIGQYSTCPHGCVYCYANSSHTRAKRNYERYCRAEKEGIYSASITGYPEREAPETCDLFPQMNRYPSD